MLKEKEPVYCFGELVHYWDIMELEQDMLISIIEDTLKLPKQEKLVVGVCGANKQFYIDVEKQQIPLIDLTCPKIANIHKKMESYTKRGYDIFYIGKKESKETATALSFANENVMQIEDEIDIEKAIEKLEKQKTKKVAIISQPTFSIEKIEKLVTNIQNKLDEKIKLVIEKTTCVATKIKKEETKQLARQVEMMIVMGAKESSHTNRLYQIALQYCGNAMIVEKMEDLYINYIRRFKKVRNNGNRNNNRRTN